MTQTSDAFGSLTALFTSESTPSQGAAGHGAAVAPVIVALVGNLPVMAGLWTTQLADEIARHGGPTALVRFERGEVTVELLRADGRQLPPPAQDAVARWLPRGAAMARRWVVCVPAETPPAEVLASGGELVLLTGADEAAVVHAYHRLKHLADEATHRGEPLTRVGLVVVGAPQDRVDAVAAKLTDAARSFLGLELAVVSALPKLERVQSSARVSYPSAETPPFEEFMQGLVKARAEASQRFEGSPSNGTHTSTGEPQVSTSSSDGNVHMTTPSFATVEPVSSGTAAPRAARAAAAVVAAVPVLPPQKLVPFLRSLRPLGISCPTVPDVELALDEAGRLQIVGRADQLARVRAAHTWAHQHQQLLALAFPELNRQFTVLERLLLNDAREAISLHGTGVLLDLLVQVETPSGPVHTVVALNDAATAG